MAGFWVDPNHHGDFRQNQFRAGPAHGSSSPAPSLKDLTMYGPKPYEPIHSPAWNTFGVTWKINYLRWNLTITPHGARPYEPTITARPWMDKSAE